MKKISRLEQLTTLGTQISGLASASVPWFYISKGELDNAAITLVAGLLTTYAFGMVSANSYNKRIEPTSTGYKINKLKNQISSLRI